MCCPQVPAPCGPELLTLDLLAARHERDVVTEVTPDDGPVDRGGDGAPSWRPRSYARRVISAERTQEERMDLGLDDRVVIVTGGSSGIGAALAAAYGREGARVAVTYRTGRDDALDVVAQIERAGGKAMATPFDLSDPDGAPRMVDEVVARWGRVDVLAANAIAWPRNSPGARFEDLPRETWADALRTNVEGTFAVTQAVLPHMRAGRWGRILFTSTGLAEEGMPGGEVYTASKMALHGFARSLAWGVGKDGILVNVIAAGFTLTERNRSVIPGDVLDGVGGSVPLGRLSEPEDVAAPALFLTSAANTSVTGEVLREGSSTGRSSHSF